MAKKRRICSFPVVVAVCMFLSLSPSAHQSGEMTLLSGETPNPHGLFPAEQIRFTVGADPRAVAVGDVNGDSTLDIVTSNNDDDTVSVLMGNGDGTFATQVVYDVGNGPRAVSLGDLNGDGALDIVAINQHDNDVSVLLGNGDGTFADQLTYNVGSQPLDGAIGDVNGDGALDIVTANFSEGTVSVLIGNGDGTFVDQVAHDAGWAPHSVFLGDVNGDGALDIAVSNALMIKDNTVSVLLGNGDGTFEGPAIYPIGTLHNSVFLGDVNGDGTLDIVTSNDLDDNISVLFGNGDGTFAGQVTYYVGRLPGDVCLCDLNEDGALDVITANWDDGDLSILFGNGDGTFANQATYNIGRSPSRLSLGDLNGDGAVDIVTTNSSEDAVSVLMGNGDGTFGGETLLNQFTYAASTKPSSASLGDVNGDGLLDTIVADVHGHSVWVLLGAAGTFTPQLDYEVGHNPSSVVLEDVDDDEMLDIVTANKGDNNVSVLLSNGDGTFGAQTTYRVGGAPQGVSLGDINGDGMLDMVTANYYDDNVSVLISNGDGTFASQVTHPVGDGPVSVGLGDLNGDGLLDIVTTNRFLIANTISVLLGNGDGTFAPHVTYDVGGCPCAVFLSDLDENGTLDIVTANKCGNDVSVLLGNGDGTFAPHVTYDVGDWPCAVFLSDLDENGTLDIVTANEGSDDVSVLLGNGDGTFASVGQVAYGVGNSPQSVSLGDLDRDGALDILTANFADGTASVLLGNGDGTFESPTDHPVGHTPEFVTLGNVDGDIPPDILVAGGNLSVLLGGGDGRFETRVTYCSSNTYSSISVGNLDADGEFDVVATNKEANDVLVLMGNGDGTFTDQFSYGVGNGPRHVALGDLNSDSVLDVVIANAGDANVSVLMGNGDGTFAEQVTYGVGDGPLFVSLGDLNGDGALDIVTANGESVDVSVLIGNGDGTFAEQVIYDAGTFDPFSEPSVCFISLGDLNQDEILDILAVTWFDSPTGYDNPVSVLMGNGDGTFSASLPLDVGTLPIAAFLVDVDGDGKCDVVTADNSKDSISIILGYGDGTFTEQVSYALAGSPSSMAIGDLNYDGGVDIVTANGGENVSVLLNLRGQTMADDNYEDNDSKSEVDACAPGEPCSPNLGPIDSIVMIPNLIMADVADWYRFETLWPSGMGHTARVLFSHSQGNLDVKLLAADGTTVLAIGDSDSDNEEISLDGLAAGTYYLKVYGRVGARNPNYSLEIIPGSLDDVYEENDSVAVVDSRSAEESNSPNFGPASGTITIQNLVLGTDGHDYYKFITSAQCSSSHLVAITFLHADGDLQLELLDDTGKVIDSSVSATDNEQISLDGLAEGTYYVHIYGEGGAHNVNYDLTIDVPLWVDDLYEDNDSKTIVDGREEGGDYSPNLGLVSTVWEINDLVLGTDGEDWFRFETAVTGSQNDYVRTEFATSYGDLDLMLLDANGAVLKTSHSGTDNERVSVHGLPPGAYYARVFSPVGATNDYYRLFIQTAAPQTRMVVSPFTTDSTYTLEYEIDGVPGSSDFDLEIGLNELVVTVPGDGNETFEVVFDVTRIGSMADQTETNYDLLGNPSRVTNSFGRETVPEYDGLGRLVGVTDPTSGDFSELEYNGNDNLIRMEDNTGTTEYVYNELDQLTQIILPDSLGTIDYDYDLAGRLTSLTYPDTTVVTYGYDAAGQLETVTHGTDVTSYTYNAAGQVKTVTLPNGITGRYTYDDYGRLTHLEYTNSGGLLVASLNHTLDNNGNRTDMEVRRPDTNTPDPNDYIAGIYAYQYDALDRLAQASYPDGMVTEYTYDAVGNRLSTSIDADGNGPQSPVVEDYNYGYDNRLYSITDANGSPLKKFFYDPLGNMVMLVTPTKTIHYEYDYRNLLITVNDGTNRIEYEYDGNGGRVAKVVNGARTTYINNPNRQHTQVLLELDGTGAVQASYVYGLGRISGKLPGEADSVYYIADALGSTTDLTDAAGSALQSYSYDAFGALRPTDPCGGTGSLTNEFLFTGECVDSDIGLIYLRARYYDPTTGRFLSKDPSGFADGANLYLYLQDNPLNGVDPSGQMPSDDLFDRLHRNEPLYKFTHEDFRSKTYYSGPSAYERYLDMLLHAPIGRVEVSDFWRSYMGTVIGGAASIVVPGIDLLTSRPPPITAYHDFESYFFGRGRSLSYYTSGSGSQWKPADRGGVLLNKAVDFVGDLSSITGATVDPVTGQVVLLGTDDANATVPDLRLDDFVTAVKAVFGSAEYPGVTIDPQEGHEHDPAYPQIVHLFAGLEDTDAGYVLYEADRVMKCLAAREDNITGNAVSSSVPGYYSMLDRWWDRAQSQGCALGEARSRFWFVPSEVKLVRSDDGQSFVFDRAAVQLLTEDMLVGNGMVDPDAWAFANWFNANFDAIAAEAYPYPSMAGYEYSFRRLEQVARAIAFARFLQDNSIPVNFSWIENYEVPFVDTPETTPTVENSRTGTCQSGGNTYTLTITVTGGVVIRTPNTYIFDTGMVGNLSTAALSDRPDELTQYWATNADGQDFNAVALSLNDSYVDGLDSRADTDLRYQTPGDVPLELSRYYSSAEPIAGPFGFGWEFAPFKMIFTHPEFYSTSRSEVTFLNGLRTGEIRVIDQASGRVLTFESSFVTARLGYYFLYDGINAEGVPDFTPGGSEQPDGSTLTQDANTMEYTLTGPGGLQVIFDQQGRILQATDAYGRAITYNYTDDKVTSISDGNGQTIVLSYDGEGRVSQAVGLNGEIVDHTYDVEGNLTSADRVREGESICHTYDYDDDHHLSAVTTPDEIVEDTSISDLLGRTTMRMDSRDNLFSSDFDPATRTTVTTDTTSGTAIVRETDSHGRPTVVTDQTGRVFRYSYAGLNRQPSTVELPDPERPPLMFDYDDRGNLTAAFDPARGGDDDGNGVDDNPQIFEYDANNNLIRYQDARGLVTELTYNEFNRRTSMTRAVGTPLAATWTWTYDPMTGFLASQTDPSGVVTAFEYDGLGNLVTQTVAPNTPPETVTTFVYDSFSRPTAIQDGMGRTTSLVYNGRDRVESVTLEGSTPLVSLSTYDATTGRRLTVTDFNGNTKSFAYDSNTGDLIDVNESGSVTKFAYNRFGNIERIIDPVGNVTLFEYDDLQRLVRTISLGSTPRIIAAQGMPSGIDIEFSEPIDAALVDNGTDIFVEGSQGQSRAGTIEFSDDGRNLIWTPDTNALSSDVYTVTLRAQDMTGFVTKDGVPLDGEFFGALPTGDNVPGGDFIFSWMVDDHGNNAAVATVIVPFDSVAGELEFTGDVDWFAITVNSENVYQFEVTLGTLTDSYLRLYGTDGQTLLAENDDIDPNGGDRASRLESWQPPQDGIYYVSVRSYGDELLGTYDLICTIIVDDHGGTAAEATPITVPDAIQGNLAVPSDIDMFSFQAVQGQEYRVATILGTLQNSVVTVFDTDGQTVLDSNDDVDYPEDLSSRLNWQAPSDDQYYLSVSSAVGSDSSGTYTLTLSVDDHNDTPAQATAATVGSPLAGEVAVPGDVDWFSFQASAGSNYRLDGIPGTLGTMSLSLYDSALALLDTKVSDSNATIYFHADATDTFFAQVDGLGETGSYDFVVTEPTDDHGNDAATATSITVPSVTWGELEMPDDADWFSFDAVAGSRYRIRVMLQSLADSYLTLYDTNGVTELMSNDDYAGLASRIDWDVPDSGTYYVAVTCHGARYAGTYSLSVEDLELLPPEGQLVTPAPGSITNQDLGYVDVNWIDLGGAGVDSNTIDKTDVNISSVAVTEVEYIDHNTWRYHYSGAIDEGVVEVTLLANHVADTAGNWNAEATYGFSYYVACPQADIASAEGVGVMDCQIDFYDLAVVTTHWLESCSDPNWCENSDFDTSGSINFEDFAVLADEWKMNTKSEATSGSSVSSNQEQRMLIHIRKAL